MTASDYEYECMRAELLGLKKPDKTIFAENDVDVSSVETLAIEGEQLGHINGGLDELNSVIGSTKKKLTRFQSLTGRLGRLIKKSSDNKSSPTPKNAEHNSPSKSGSPNQRSAESGNSCSSFKAEEVERQVDRLDQLLMKAEHAELSLGYNNKLIKKITNK
ncbi:uncharacterized protein LOC106663290 [Cimex lectularius]|uniref:Uncharacterized protein n=1 Tax=Cimex lectularius TaxID=79782 RepID=A0A8I6RCE3_CIMLE|nr:uncharacterized protein LOC106663290 [Cimex lectularius]